MNRYYPVFIALAGSLLLWLAWPMSPLTFLIFIAWVPLLWLDEHTSNTWKYFAAMYLMLLTWNILTTWWIWNASPPGALGAFFVNSLIMCVPWLLARLTRRAFGTWIGYGSIILYWVSFEFIHHNWELSWPWLTLGNAFALRPEWIQWYEYSGSVGGTIWVLIANILAYSLFMHYRRAGRNRAYYIRLISFVVVLMLPILWSRVIATNEKEYSSGALKGAVKNVVVVQPNIDAYEEKYTRPVDDQLNNLIFLSEQKIDQNTSLVVWPETAVPAQVEESRIKENRFYFPIFSFLRRHPKITLVTGIESYLNYGPGNKATATARHDKSSGIYYDMFNTAAQFEEDTSIQLYHKAKLVPGVESLPSFLGFMSAWFEDFGGTSGTLGRDTERKVFIPWDEHFKSAPIICYESIYGDYITEYVRKGANILTIITNDGWWGNTPGYKQHMNYGRLRAIETRKWVARSANTGISCFIDPLGNVINPQPWDVASSIRLNIPVDNRQTFFVKHGDITSRAMLKIAIALIVVVLTMTIRTRIIERKNRSPRKPHSDTQ